MTITLSSHHIREVPGLIELLVTTVRAFAMALIVAISAF
jgi:hypothetical protein